MPSRSAAGSLRELQALRLRPSRNLEVYPMTQVVGIGIDLVVFRPVERRVLRARGLAIGA